MPIPAYSPSGGVGSTHTDPSTGITYQYYGGTSWLPISSGSKQQSSSGGGSSGGSVQKQSGGWYWNPTTGQSEQYWAPGQGPSSGGSNQVQSSMPSIDDFSSQINDVYNPAFEHLNTLSTNAVTDRDAALASSGEQYALVRKNSEQLYNRNLGVLNENQQDVEGEKRSALSDAIRSYNALNQARQSRFGGGSSAGEAVGEVAKGEFFRGQADIEKSYVQQAKQIRQSIDDLALQQQQYILQNELEEKQANAQLQSEFRNIMAQIEGNKSQLQSAKAAARLNLMQQYAAESRNIKLTFAEHSAQIKESIAASKAELTGKYDELIKISQSYDAGQYFDYDSPYDTASLNAKPQGGTAYNYARNPYAKKDEDEYDLPFIGG